MSYTRRDVLRGAAGAAGASLTVGTVTAQSEYDHWQAQPDHVTLNYSEQTLLEYAPRLVLTQNAREKWRGLWGWTATSPEYELDHHVYVALYTHQDGVGSIGKLLSDSHVADTEWAYVLSDSETGETQHVIYDAYHWVAGRLNSSSITMDGQHPVGRVIDPWHFYSFSNTDTGAATAFEQVHDLTAEFDALLSNGLAESLEPGTVTDPATMQARNHWWRSAIGELSTDAMLASVVYDLGWVGADQADSSALAF